MKVTPREWTITLNEDELSLTRSLIIGGQAVVMAQEAKDFAQELLEELR